MPGPRRRRHGVDEREYDSQEEENWLMRNDPQAQSRPLNPEEVKASISEFSGESAVTSWLRKLDHYKRIYNWTDGATLLYATTRLTGSAKLWYSSVKEDIFSYRDFKKMMVTNYADDADIHRELMAASKSHQESYDRYVFRMQSIAKGHMPQSTLIEYIISGLSRDELYDQIASEEYRTIIDLLQRLNWCEADFRMQNPNNSVARVPLASRAMGNEGRTAAMVPVASPTVAPKLSVSMISASDQDPPATAERMDTDDDGMMEEEAIIGPRLKQLKQDSGSADENEFE